MKKTPKCKRPGCPNVVLVDIPEAKRDFLCAEHCARRLENQKKRLMKATQKCARYGCENTLNRKQNTHFCSRACRGIASRLIECDDVHRIVTHSYWYSIEGAIRRNPKGIASLASISDIAEIINLHQKKAQYQKAYTSDENSAESEMKLITLVPLELCHFYPNSKGGMNTGINLLIAPKWINQLRSNKVPEASEFTVLMGVKAEGGRVEMTGTLNRYLIEHVSEDELRLLYLKIGRLKEFRFYKEKPTNFTPERYDLTFTPLLISECQRIGLPMIAIKLELFMKFFTEEILYIEILSLCLFYSLLSSDKDKLIHQLLHYQPRVKQKNGDYFIEVQEELDDEFKQDWITVINNAVHIFFRRDITTKKKRHYFYHSFFNIPKKVEPPKVMNGYETIIQNNLSVEDKNVSVKNTITFLFD